MLLDPLNRITGFSALTQHQRAGWLFSEILGFVCLNKRRDNKRQKLSCGNLLHQNGGCPPISWQFSRVALSADARNRSPVWKTFRAPRFGRFRMLSRRG